MLWWSSLGIMRSTSRHSSKPGKPHQVDKKTKVGMVVNSRSGGASFGVLGVEGVLQGRGGRYK